MTQGRVPAGAVQIGVCHGCASRVFRSDGDRTTGKILRCAQNDGWQRYSTVTDLARLRGLSTSQPRRTAA